MKKEFQKKTFKSEEEEANWWDQQQDALLKEFGRAAAEGTLGHGTVAHKGITPTTTIRLAPEDILLARSQAERRGLKYQTYLKMVIHEALQGEEERKPSKPSRKPISSKRLKAAQSR
jgi:predicted DNA binding CopG/RHH family protein